MLLYYIMLYYIGLYYMILLYYIIWYRIISYHNCIILSYLILYYIILYCIILYCIILSYIILCYIILYYIILYCIILSYLILYYIILYYIIFYIIYIHINSIWYIWVWSLKIRDALSTLGLSMGNMTISGILLFPYSKMGKGTSQSVDYLGSLFGMCMYRLVFFTATQAYFLRGPPFFGARSKLLVVDPQKIYPFGSPFFCRPGHLEDGNLMRPWASGRAWKRGNPI